MKTLDEVIKALEMCTTSPEDDEMCPGCPYADEDGIPECVGRDKDDALHYLKEYQEVKNTRVYIPDGYTTEKLGGNLSDKVQWTPVRDVMVGMVEKT